MPRCPARLRPLLGPLFVATACALTLPACDVADPDEPGALQWRDDDFGGLEPEPWATLHPELAEAELSGGRLKLRPEANTAWYGNSEAFHRHVPVSGNFMITAQVEVGSLAGGPALPDWRLGGLLVRDPAAPSVAAYHTALGSVSSTLSAEMVVETKSTWDGNSTLGFIPNPSGVGELRICRVGTNIRALFRPDEASPWTTVDQRERPDLPETLAAGPMAYAYAPVADFEAAFDFVAFDTPTTVEDCEAGWTEAEPEPPPPPPEVPASTSACPPITDGVVTVCPAALGGTCRDVLVSNAAGGTTEGPLQVHWHGTGETPEALMEWDPATEQILAMTVAEGGVMIMPYADPEALARPTAFPWWAIGDPSDPQMQTSREDDFLLVDEAVACILEAGLASSRRINTSGFSAGGIMTSHLVERREYFASGVSWSGGTPEVYQPALPIGSTPVMAIHGGPTDLYCDGGVVGGGCFDFQSATEALAAGVVAAGHWAFVCDHHNGHATSIALEGAQFMGLASHGSMHPWTHYAFGSGANWALDSYCHASGSPSPWN